MYGGPGDDTIITQDATSPFYRIDGGPGIDTLSSPDDIMLMAFSTTFIKGIEIIELTGGASKQVMLDLASRTVCLTWFGTHLTFDIYSHC